MLDYYPEDHRFYIETELELRLKRRPQYSLRAFARDLELSPSTLSEFLNGHLGLSRETTCEVAKKLKLTDNQTQHMWDLIQSKFARNVQKRKEAEIKANSRLHSQQSKVSLDEFRFIADWYHLATLELLELNDEYQNLPKMAKALGLTKSKMKEVIERLINLKLLKREDDKLFVDSATTNVGENAPSSSIRLFHAQIMAKAHRALETQNVDQRDFSSTLFTISKSDLPEIKKDLNMAWLNIASKYSAREKKDSLYCLAIQFFNLLEKEIS
jgi:uncharacterized protein (TIGR02147 family)